MKADFSTIINSSKPVLIDFCSEWNHSCKSMIPVLQEIVRDLGDRIKIIKVDIDKNRLVAQKYEVGNLPTLMLFRGGKMMWRQAGFISRKGLIEVIFQHGWAQAV